MENKTYMRLNAFLAKEGIEYEHLSHFISETGCSEYALKEESGITGRLFVKAPEEKSPTWKDFLELGISDDLDYLINKSSSAALLVEISDRVFAYTFGYGRFLLDQDLFISDFGIKTALNTLEHDSLKGIDLFSIERAPIQKKTQATENSSMDMFGVDISRDILRSVTGLPKDDVGFKLITGGDSIYSFNIELNFNELNDISNKLLNYYVNDSYKLQFSWVDNIKRIKDDELKSILDEKLISLMSSQQIDNISVTIPEVISWDNVSGFSFTKSKNNKKPMLDIANYISNLDDEFTIEILKKHKVFVFDQNGDSTSYSLYKSLCCEISENNQVNVLFSGEWYAVDGDFMEDLNRSLDRINISSLDFPKVNEYIEGSELKIETEGNYNTRASENYPYYLLDKKTIKSRTSTTAIELCDLLTNDRKFIHVKHKKGGSAGLSHLFAQGYVSAEAMLSDREFRKKSREVLRRISNNLSDLVPLDNFNSRNYEVVYLILGDENNVVKGKLPFFSKINLCKAYDNLTQRGFTVTICGVGKERLSEN
ncbi:TIGR04141 family sporadically distributed protein [Morganella morganii]|uniref:TIGR04141 family sporadically distributed protein n=1 Tax=Morganella morganii TaxID=582 RepID=UPI00132F8228|nr:TIGR04141 family sporadically distributed protein [Morganella morganii]ELW9226507.1 TIGR04141 family sporadically distributed protein [Morganella morganii]MBT0354774.1 TIGR04141 family sporadically distributed protein [Morganella morganii subsp. morganii]NGF16231.1 hypothetical protein [Morganella morganii]